MFFDKILLIEKSYNRKKFQDKKSDINTTQKVWKLCEDRNYGYHKRGHHGHHGHHQYHCHRTYSTIAKRTGETVNIPEILFEVADIKEGDFFMIHINKIKKDKHYSP